MTVHMDQGSFRITCPACGGQIDERQDLCGHCGYDFRQYQDLPEVRRLIARYRAL